MPPTEAPDDRQGDRARFDDDGRQALGSRWQHENVGRGHIAHDGVMRLRSNEVQPTARRWTVTIGPGRRAAANEHAMKIGREAQDGVGQLGTPFAGVRLPTKRTTTRLGKAERSRASFGGREAAASWRWSTPMGR